MTHILASHPAAGHLEVVLPVVLGLQQVLGAGLEKGPHRLLILKHQVNVTCQGHQEYLKVTKHDADMNGIHKSRVFVCNLAQRRIK